MPILTSTLDLHLSGAHISAIHQVRPDDDGNYIQIMLSDASDVSQTVLLLSEGQTRRLALRLAQLLEIINDPTAAPTPRS